MEKEREVSNYVSSTIPPPLKPDEGLLDTLADVCVRAAFFRKALEIVACMEEYGIPPNKTKYTRIYVEMHSRMFTSKHASRARQDRRSERKRAAEAFKFWLGLPIMGASGGLNLERIMPLILYNHQWKEDCLSTTSLRLYCKQ